MSSAPAGLHVLALVSDGIGGRGGIARYNADLITALAASGSVGHVTVLPRLGSDGPVQLPAKVTQLPPRFNQIAYSLGALAAALRLPRPSVIFCGHILMAPLGAALSRLTGAPMWLQVHGIDAWQPASRSVRWGAEQARLVTSVSRFTRSQMIGNWWMGDPARIRILANTVDAAFKPGPKPPALVARYGLDGKKVLITVSRISSTDRYKGHDRVLAVLPRILARHPDVRYLVVGDGDDLPALRGIVAGLGLTDHVYFTGHVPGAELPDHFRAGDVFIMPSTKEGFGIVFLEAAASGLHVIGGNADGSVDALREGLIGEAIDPDDPDAILDSVCRALEMPDRPNAERVDAFSYPNFAVHVGGLIELLAGMTGPVPLPHRELESA